MPMSRSGWTISLATDRKQFAPRFGFAWRPVGDATVIRGGYGLFYEIESSGDRVNNNMVPFKLDETAFNDSAIPVRTMADFFLGTPLSSTAAPVRTRAVRSRRLWLNLLRTLIHV